MTSDPKEGLTRGNSIVSLAIPNLNHRHLVRAVPVKVIPFLAGGIGERDGLAPLFELVPPEVAWVDVGGIKTAKI